MLTLQDLKLIIALIDQAFITTKIPSELTKLRKLREKLSESYS